MSQPGAFRSGSHGNKPQDRTGNDSLGVTFTDFNLAGNAAIDPDSDPNPNRPKILNNIMQNNGNNPAPVVRAALAAVVTATGPDIVDTVGMNDGCILNPERYRTIGLDKYTECEFFTTECGQSG